MLIERCDVSCGDDHVSIKSGMNAFARAHSPGYSANNVTVRYNTFRHGMGVSVGSETAGGIRGIRVHHNTFLSASGSFCVALHVKSAAQRGGVIEQVTFSHNRVRGGSALMRLGRFGESREPIEYDPTALRTITWAHNTYEPLPNAKPVRSKFLCPGKCSGIRVENNSLPPKARWQCMDLHVEASQQPGLEGSACLEARGGRRGRKRRRRRVRPSEDAAKRKRDMRDFGRSLQIST